MIGYRSSKCLIILRAAGRAAGALLPICERASWGAAATRLVRAFLISVTIGIAAAGAANAEVCVRTDETHDTLPAAERRAAELMLTRQFELAGIPVGSNCSMRYTVSHTTLGTLITVTLTGPGGQRQATANGWADLPAIYSQLVRSLVVGRGVVDRTNVSVSQAAPLRVHSDSFPYARLGYGVIFGDRAYGTPSLGFGYRAELDSIALDVSFLNVQAGAANSYIEPGATSGSALKLSVLHFVRPATDATPYVGGGLSWGGTSFQNGSASYASNDDRTVSPGWHGSGLQGELTAGYEFARTTTIRLFVQADAILPFYRSVNEPRSMSTAVPRQTRYTPSFVVSLGLGWHKNRN